MNQPASALLPEASYCCFCNAAPTPASIFCEAWITGHERNGEAYRVERNGFPSYLLNCTVSGRGVLECRGRKYELEAGDLVLIDCRESHVFYTLQPDWEIVFLHFDGLQGEALYRRYQDCCDGVLKGEGDPTAAESVITQILALHRYLFSLPHSEENLQGIFFSYSSDDDAYYQAAEKISSVLIALTARLNRTKNSRLNRTVQLGMRYMDEHYNRRITLDEIAGAAYVSKFHFERLFREATHQTVMKYLTDIRYRRALQLLDYGAMSPEAAANAVGWDLQVMNRVFRRRLGLTAKQFSRRQCSQRVKRDGMIHHTEVN